ncbi:GNAT family N-acetyltransferase [Nocardioides gansuensis]|uniref:GNAT family N-acetyltransferase n=1 Tax=Nocardioides gansuensis TaxID=2138300 RepID=A0A2T8F6K1_9ACTN|nr:GNAT family N-acetyltransferase [Nocardioides gansuensis]PVG81341.1 GNAT family N-acetyltransferase [Nocardioides gansuensis]
MELEFFDVPRPFLAAAGDLLAADPVLGTVVATVSERLARELDEGIGLEAAHPRWWVVARDGSEVVGCGMRTAPFQPHPAFLLPMPDEAALLLARAVHERGEELRGVNGALPASRVCADELARLTGGRVEVAQHTRLHEATSIEHPPLRPGSLRLARPEEVELCLTWFEAFGRDADEQAGREPGSMHELTDDVESMGRRIAGGRIWLWVDEDDRPVHLTGANDPAFGVARIGPVYTPPEHRGLGYASAAVAQVSQRLLDAGARVCLFTDQANPVSNKVYERIGYEPVVDMANLTVV